MNIQEIDKWLDNEYGMSYTKLEELHDWLCDRETEKDKEIENLNKDATRLLEKYKEKSIRIDKAIKIINKALCPNSDYVDYDGFNNVEDLKGLIDMLVQYAVESRNILRGENKE